MSERLTGTLDTKCSMSPWDWCGQDSTCKRDCFKPDPCNLPYKLRRLAEYEDLCFDASGNEIITIDRLRELVALDVPLREGRVVVCEYNQCYKCPQVMKRTIKDEPCASCYARYEKSHSPTSRKETKPDDDQGSD